MKKNKMMRLASALLVAVLLTTSIISGTFAKYVTSDSVADSARVAKFGVVVTATGSLFDETYIVADANTPGGVESTAQGEYDADDIFRLTVESSNGDKLVAPGTKNEKGITVSVTGTPEVDVKVTLDLTVENDVFLKAGAMYPDMTTGDTTDGFIFENDYYPVEYTLTRDGKTVLNGVTIAEVKDYLEKLVAGDNDGYYDANTDLSKVIGELVLTWKWNFTLTDEEVAQINSEISTRFNKGSQEQIKMQEEFGVPSGSLKEVYQAAAVAAAAKLQDQQDTLLGDFAAGLSLDGQTYANDFTNNYNLTTGISIAITVTQVD